jgi:hypothetical protein
MQAVLEFSLVCFRCNDSVECPLGDDEEDCDICEADQFKCPNGKCILVEWVCDGVNDCGDDSDEDTSICHNQQATEGKYQCIFIAPLFPNIENSEYFTNVWYSVSLPLHIIYMFCKKPSDGASCNLM